ncbi:hypothetical protein [Pseudorhodoferax sp.]|uniref:hypothetical protein n=1 Tax=Pseudorhodoferax sp. TaxID=1993553 RepID=UPI0039E4BD2C
MAASRDVRGRSVRKAQPGRFDHSGPGLRDCCEVQSQRHEVRFDDTWEMTDRAAADCARLPQPARPGTAPHRVV